MKDFAPVADEIRSLVEEWESRLQAIPVAVLSDKTNSQNRTVKQILGHLVDSASNNLHRIVHLQYGASPLFFPDYAAHGNNDRWIAIQGYQSEDWSTIVQLWKWSNLHLAYVIGRVDKAKSGNQWIAGTGEFISLNDVIINYLPHLKLHLNQIAELL